MKPQLLAHEIAANIAAGAMSAHEAVFAHVQQIQSTHAVLNAVVVPRFDEALSEAAFADSARSRGLELGPLHGVPITVKESFDLTGTPTTAGLTARASHRAVRDAWVVERLRQAGAIVLGKTNVSHLLLHDSCSNPLYGRTSNPWQLDRSPGASSGGEAAILAAGGSALGIGSDIGGSVRLPAHACGVYSLKPTSQRLSLEGHISLFPESEVLMCQPGPLARSVKDLVLAMRVLAGSEWQSLNPDGLSRLRIGFYSDNGMVAPSPAIQSVVTTAARALEQRGLHVEEWQPPDPDAMWRVYLALLIGGGMRKAKELSRGSKLSPKIRLMLNLDSLPKAAFSMASRVSRLARQHDVADIAAYCAEPYERTIQRKEELCSVFMKKMDSAQIDAIVCPVFAVPALRHRVDSAIDESLSYTAMYNFLGMPAGVVAATRVDGNESSRSRSNRVERAASRVEAGSSGLPVGVQVVARHWREDVVLGIMGLLEEYFRSQPDYPARSPRLCT